MAHSFLKINEMNYGTENADNLKEGNLNSFDV